MMPTPAANQPLTGIGLIDRTQMLSGAHAAMLLADLGCTDALREPRFDTARVPANPIELSVDSARAFAPPPLLGADTTDVFLEWTELPVERISARIEKGILQQGEYPN